MNFKKTLIFGFIALLFLNGVYFYTVMKEKRNQELDDVSSQIVYLKNEHINYIEIQNKNTKYVFQKNDKGWSIEEPITDVADSQRVDDVITQLTNDKHLAVAKSGAGINWAEFGLDTPEALIILKNNLGQSQKIFISSTKNFEGNHYARIDNHEKILVVNPKWYNFSTENLVYFREKSLYRGPIAALKKITVKSLRDQFTLASGEKGWYSPIFEHHVLDQNKVRAMIKAIAENTIQEYISEGDPSDMERKEKGLNKDYAEVIFETANERWSVVVNLHEKDKALYALTEKPTYLVKLDLSQWELFGNLNLDALRDRKNMMAFDIKQVSKMFLKSGNKSVHLVKNEKKWEPDPSSKSSDKFDQSDINELIDQVHNLEISYFLPENEGKEFTGKDMIILKSSEDQLLFQLNWGPLHHKKISGLEKDFYLARTQASDNIFGLNKSYIEDLPLEEILENQPIMADATADSDKKERKK